ncbi:hypothetical protein BHE74_00032621 [Ensete ventricosum]|nr:hypothetical protein BHE74_00032621 [Ensete ventricosum]
MAGRYDSDPFQEEDVNPFAVSSTICPTSSLLGMFLVIDAVVGDLDRHLAHSVRSDVSLGSQLGGGSFRCVGRWRRKLWSSPSIVEGATHGSSDGGGYYARKLDLRTRPSAIEEASVLYVGGRGSDKGTSTMAVLGFMARGHDSGVRGKAAGPNYGGGSLGSADLKKKERELQTREAELNKREKVSRSGCLQSSTSSLVSQGCGNPVQQVYMYFRGSGKAAEMKREAARGAMRAAI